MKQNPHLAHHGAGAWRCALATLALCGACAAAEPARPESYPKVDLIEQSDPRYSALALDEESTRVAYLLFDGNIDKGYDRLYVWVPGDMKFGRPQPLRMSEESKFPPISVNKTAGAKDKFVTDISWVLNWSFGGGKHVHVDYATGQKIERDIPKYVGFHFNVDYLRKPRISSLTKEGTTDMMDITIPGGLAASAIWTNCPQAIAPWKQLYLRMSTLPVVEKGRQGFVFKGGLSYYNQQAVTLRAISQDMEILLTVAPYLEQPLFSNTVSAADAFGLGKFVEAPFGWYDVRWVVTDPGLFVRTNHDWDGYYGVPIPLTKPARR